MNLFQLTVPQQLQLTAMGSLQSLNLKNVYPHTSGEQIDFITNGEHSFILAIKMKKRLACSLRVNICSWEMPYSTQLS